MKHASHHPSHRCALNASTIALAAAALFSSAATWAQQAEPGVQALDTVVVTGVRQSAESAQNIKRNADKVVDSIVADDIGKFPDSNVTEALGHVTGIQITRNAGEGDEVRIRGLREVSTLLNGREVFTSFGRFIRLADVPANMLSRVDVYKSQSADLIEGGVAGVIDVRTRRPFDFNGLSAAVNVKAEYNDKARSTNPNVNGLISNRWKTDAGEFGALLGLSLTESKYHQEIAFNNRPVPLVGDASNPVLGTDGKVIDGLTAPDGVMGLQAIKGDRKRNAANAAFQWRPNADIELYAEGFRTHLDNRHETAFFVGLPFISGNRVATVIPGTKQLQTLTADNAFTIMSTQAFADVSNTDQYAVGGHWEVTPEWRLSSEISRTKSSFNWRNPILDTSIVVPRVAVNTNTGGGAPSFQYTGVDLKNAANYNLFGFFDRYGSDSGKATDWRADAEYTPSGTSVLKDFSVGLRLTDRKASSIKADGRADIGGAVTAFPGLACVSDPLNGNYGLNQWFTPCANFLLDNTSVIRQQATGKTTPRDTDPASYFSDSEKTSAAYAKARLSFALGNVPVETVLGVRAVRTEATVGGNGSKDGVFSPTSQKSSSTEVLPSLNMKFNFQRDLIGRLAAGKTLTRPNFPDLNPAVALVSPSATLNATGAGGNPDLKPVKANNYDGSIEWYFAPAGSITAAVFRHDFNGYVQNKVTNEVFNSVTYAVTRPYNTTSGTLNGIELSYQQFYDGLPSVLKGLGLQANMTYSKGDAKDTGASQPITGVSKIAYNLIGLYENGPLSARLSYNWRDKFVDTYNVGLNPGLDLIVAPTSQMDASISYKLTDKFTVSVDAINLLDSKYRDYRTDATVYPRDYRRYDRTFGLGLRWKL